MRRTPEVNHVGNFRHSARKLYHVGCDGELKYRDQGAIAVGQADCERCQTTWDLEKIFNWQKPQIRDQILEQWYFLDLDNAPNHKIVRHPDGYLYAKPVDSVDPVEPVSDDDDFGFQLLD